MLKDDGDFLVRESSNSPGQFVLSGRQMGKVKHLLLVDPEGVVSVTGENSKFFSRMEVCAQIDHDVHLVYCSAGFWNIEKIEIEIICSFINCFTVASAFPAKLSGGWPSKCMMSHLGMYYNVSLHECK